MKYILIITIAFFITACVNPINLRTAHNYFENGLQNIKNDKWSDAQKSFSRAWLNADLGNAKDKVTAVYAYEYGRASGVICDWVESEKGFLKALELDKKTNGPIHMSLVELANMYYAKGSFLESEKYFSIAKKKLDAIEIDTKDSIGYANFLKTYANLLNELNKKDKANTITKREEEIRNTFKNRKSRYDITPYGKYCNK